MSTLAPTLQAFFTDRLMRQRQVSPNTIAAYRDAWKLLLGFASQQSRKAPSNLDIVDLDAEMIAAFLDHLEHERAQQRLDPKRSTGRDPLPVPVRGAASSGTRRRHRARAGHPTQTLRPGPGRLPHRPRRSTRCSPRPTYRLGPAAATTPCSRSRSRPACGSRNSSGCACEDIHLGTGAHVACHGKGRKDRITPLIAQTIGVVRAWLSERGGEPTDPLFCSRRGTALSRDAIERRLAIYTRRAADGCPTLHTKPIRAHMLRHTAAMRLLPAGIDTSVIALWLGHENVETTQIYLHADLAIKERAIARISPPNSSPGRYRPPDTLLAFLDGL